MRIAIIDDISSECESLKRRLKVQLSRLSLAADICVYESGEEFLAAAQKERFDLAFLDIYLNNENGISIAERLRGFDADCLVVFTTTSPDHALDGFRVRAFHYLVKPYSDEALTALFDEIVKRFPHCERYIEVNGKRVRFRDIMSAEHYQHQIFINLADGGKIITRQTFRDFTAALTDERFFLCGRGVIVNLECVEDFNGSDFVLKNGTCIPVSRDLAKSARQAFGDFLFGRSGKV